MQPISDEFKGELFMFWLTMITVINWIQFPPVEIENGQLFVIGTPCLTALRGHKAIYPLCTGYSHL
jgi:hypothetical protein